MCEVDAIRRRVGLAARRIRKATYDSIPFLIGINQHGQDRSLDGLHPAFSRHRAGRIHQEEQLARNARLPHPFAEIGNSETHRQRYLRRKALSRALMWRRHTEGSVKGEVPRYRLGDCAPHI